MERVGRIGKNGRVIMFSNQKGYCRVCGAEMLWNVGSSIPYSGLGVCGKECCQEYHWRETLSILGKEYYPDPKGDTPRDS